MDLPWCSDFDRFSNENDAEHPINIKLGQNALLICDFSIVPSGFDYTKFSIYYGLSDDPEGFPCYEKIEFEVNGKKLAENQYEQIKSIQEYPGYDNAKITDSNLMNTFNNKTIVKIRLIKCVRPGDTKDRYHFCLGD